MQSKTILPPPLPLLSFQKCLFFPPLNIFSPYSNRLISAPRTSFNLIFGPFANFCPFFVSFLIIFALSFSRQRFPPCSLLTVFFPPPVWHLLISVLQGSLYFTIYTYTTEVCIIIAALNVNTFLIFWTNCVEYMCAGWATPGPAMLDGPGLSPDGRHWEALRYYHLVSLTLSKLLGYHHLVRLIHCNHFCTTTRSG